MGASRTINTKLTKKKSGSEQEDLTIGHLTSIGEIGIESEEIDVTDLDSTGDFKEYIAGRGVFTLEPDKEAGCNGFLIPKEISKNMETHEEILPDTLSAVAVEFHDPWVWWYRD